MAAPQTAVSTPSALPSIIPPPDPTRRRTLVLCFDGTGDQFDTDNSNVIQLFSLLQKDDHSQQMVYYQAGIGTYTIPQIATPFWAKVNQTVDMAIAWNMHGHVMEGYSFLMENYQAGDKICIFGFSRGAYTARSLAGMLHKVGLLPAGNHQQVPFAYKMYTQCDETGWKQSVAFKKAFSINVDIEFVGVWDTVCSVGLIPRRLPFVSSNTAIRYFRHAVSLDERRAKFKANLYNRPTEDENKLGVQPGEMPTPTAVPAVGNLSAKDISVTARTLDMLNKYAKIAGQEFTLPKLPKSVGKRSASSDEEGDEDARDSRYDTEFFTEPEAPKKETDVVEVWFSGCHCDVGGGSVPNDTRHNLARIPLRWMIRQCFLANTGIRFHTALLPNVGIDPNSLYPIVRDRLAALTPEDVVSDEEFAQLQAQALQAAPITASPMPLPTTPAIAASTELTPPGMHGRQDSTQTLVSDSPALTPAKETPPSPLPLTLPYMLPPTLGKTTKTRLTTLASGALSEEEEDLADLLCPLYDQLSLAPGWWVLEVLPMTQRFQAKDDTWVEEVTVNLGHGRIVPFRGKSQKVKFHRSVQIREKAGDGWVEWADKKTRVYKPVASWKPELEIEYVA